MNISTVESYIENGQYQELEQLLRAHPELARQSTSHGISPLLLSCYYNKMQAFRIILQFAQGITIHEAAAAGLTNYVEAILKQQADTIHETSSHGYSPLGIACQFSKEDVVRLLLLNKADPNIPTQNGYMIYPIITASQNNNTAILKLLLEANTEVNVQQSTGETALHYAAQAGNIESIILLLEAGANTQIANLSGKFPFNLAAEKGFKEIAEILK